MAARPIVNRAGGWPLAYFLTWTTYGSRLHGDERSSVDREHNAVGEPGLPQSRALVAYERSLLRSPPVVLDRSARQATATAVTETCSVRGWDVWAVHVRTNHVHVVVGATASPETVLTALKANATRLVRLETDFAQRKIWTRHGSTRYLWTEEAIADAVEYVRFGQGPDI